MRLKGFTLIELLVVMAILGLLATVGLGSFRSSQIKGRDARRKADLNQIQKALEMYYNDHGKYPLTAEFPSGGTAWEDDSGTLYINEVPEDPKFDDYDYISSDSISYKLYARLENENDPAFKTGGYAGTNCGSELCNYGVSSGNVNL